MASCHAAANPFIRPAACQHLTIHMGKPLLLLLLQETSQLLAGVSLDLAQLVPGDKSHWAYAGSLTTPPCTEGVLWLLLQQPLRLSMRQVGGWGPAILGPCYTSSPDHAACTCWDGCMVGCPSHPCVGELAAAGPAHTCAACTAMLCLELYNSVQHVMVHSQPTSLHTVHRVMQEGPLHLP
jgi:hypothetical protein